MTRPAVSFIAALAVVTCVVMAEACGQARGNDSDSIALGAETRLGEGTFSSFTRFDRDRTPLAIGVVFSVDALKSLPMSQSDEHRCFDHDANGAIEATECMPMHERVIPLPTETTRRSDIPFKWVLLNWNPAGHAPPHVYDLPHFDIHYFMDSIENTFALMPGPCGGEFLRCDQFERAVRPVPSEYVHPDFKNVDAAAPAMGNHLVDLTSKEFNGGVFDRTWIYGSYDGRVTFWEEMVTRDYLASRPNTCFDIKAPAAVEVAGYYPTQSCFRTDPETDELSVSIEGFVYREASPPAQSD